MDKEAHTKLADEDIEKCISTLEFLVQNEEAFMRLPKEVRIELMKVAGKISRPDRDLFKKRRKARRKMEREAISNYNKQIKANTGIRKAREFAVFEAPSQLLLGEGGAHRSIGHLKTPRNCYVCKELYTEIHHFYDTMCSSCGDFNYTKRFQTADLEGQVVFITGARLKIGYQAALLLLKSGAHVVMSTRFPNDAAKRFATEKDFDKWKNRLDIYGLDLRHTPSVELFTAFFKQHYQRLDHIINNAAQTVRRPPGFYAHLMAHENCAFEDLPQAQQLLLTKYQYCKEELMSLGDQDFKNSKALSHNWGKGMTGIGIVSSANLSQVPYSFDQHLSPEEVFPSGQLDADLQQVDLRKTNSWRLKLGEIETAEMLEVQLVNAVAPFVINNRLIPLMKEQNTGNKHIVNVTAMEGKFHTFKKEDRHPHTNMAKAALNMMTHTSASDLAKHGIYTNAVDTGWVTDEDPIDLVRFKEDKHDFQPPLDIVDGAARIIDPIFDGINTGKHWSGKFLKDYFPISW